MTVIIHSLFDDVTFVQPKLYVANGSNGRVYCAQPEVDHNAIGESSETFIDNTTLKLFDIPPDTTLKRKSASIVSPLRYPGSKRRFASYVAETLKANDYKPKLLVEPFAGGLSVALQMLADNLVEQIGIGESDPLVASFWQCVFFDTDWLIEAIQSLEVSIGQWHYYKTFIPITVRERALTCLFLNRTSFSGILNQAAGPIGGIEQASAYAVGCRFTKSTIIKRILQASSYKERVAFIHNDKWQNTIAHSLAIGFKPKDIFCYLDPPFYNKASKLYRHFFEDADHLMLREALRRQKYKWLLSYDAADEIKQLYSDRRMFPTQHIVELLYTLARSKEQKQVREIVVTNLTNLPKYDRVWRTTGQWK